jgi:predicted TIM-barrel fold metal-dependent hydrolase
MTPGPLRKILLAAVTALAPAGLLAAPPLPLFDAHLHYSHDAWEQLPPAAAVALMRAAGLKRALVSSSSDEGTQRLVEAAPDLVQASLRPYRQRGELSSWMHDASVIPYLEERLKRYRYVAIGEFHIYGADAELPVMRRVVELARQYRLVLHSHSDADAIERQFRQDPQARILWAHSGFDSPAKVREMLRRHPQLWCDLAFRSDHASGGQVDPAWRALFLEFPDRFMVGTDTFTPERWHFVGEHARWTREWLASLPPEVAEQIAWKNGERLLGAAPTAQRP